MGKAARRGGDMIRFRAMRACDAEAVAAIEAASFAVPWSKKSFWEEAENDLARYLIAIDGEETAGYAGIWVIAGEAQLMNIAVAPSHRGKGVGALLLEAIIREAKANGAERMTLEVRPSNEAALALYEKFGFKSFGRRPGYYLDNGEDAIIMWKMEL